MTADMLLVLAMSTDAFFAALSYSTGKIKIPVLSALIICFTGTGILTLSMAVSAALGSLISPEICRISGAVLLAAVGITSFCQNSLKSILRRHEGNGKLSFSFFNIGFVISVFLDETLADADESKVLSPKESLALAAALSLDSVSGGLGAGLSGTNIIRVGILSLVLGILAVSAGGKLGNTLSRKGPDLSWISGIFLIVLAAIKLLSF